MAKPRILAFAGSVRSESFNKRLLTLAVKFATDAGAEVSQIDLKDFPLPIFDQDLEAEQGPPANAVALKQMFKDCQGLLIASPEYNSSITPLLKNTIDWVSRPAPNEPRLVAFTGKVAGIVSASPGALGGLRGLVHLRSMLSNIGVLVLPQQLSIPKADNAFAPDGSLNDRSHQKQLTDLVSALTSVLTRLAG